jgi:hypothetical protein
MSPVPGAGVPAAITVVGGIQLAVARETDRISAPAERPGVPGPGREPGGVRTVGRWQEHLCEALDQAATDARRR